MLSFWWFLLLLLLWLLFANGNIFKIIANKNIFAIIEWISHEQCELRRLLSIYSWATHSMNPTNPNQFHSLIFNWIYSVLFANICSEFASRFKIQWAIIEKHNSQIRHIVMCTRNTNRIRSQIKHFGMPRKKQFHWLFSGFQQSINRWCEENEHENEKPKYIIGRICYIRSLFAMSFQVGALSEISKNGKLNWIQT